MSKKVVKKTVAAVVEEEAVEEVWVAKVKQEVNECPYDDYGVSFENDYYVYTVCSDCLVQAYCREARIEKWQRLYGIGKKAA